jgi:SNF2 family DNA or RNA helicase
MRYNTILVTLPKKVQELYKQLQSDLIVEFEKASENKEEIVVAEYAGALLMKLRQICQGAIYLDDRSTKYLHQVKLDMLASILETGVRVLCPIQFKFDLTIIQKKYPNAPYIGGGLSAANTKKLITQWNNKQIPLLLCHPLSLSHGVNLQFGSNVIVWYSLPWSLEQYQQLNKRLHRIGQKETVIIHHILAKGTVDEQVLKALKSKENVQDSLLNYFKNLER